MEQRAGITVEIIRIRIEEDKSGILFATSPDMEGLLVAEHDLESLKKEIPNTIKLMFMARGVDVCVLPAHKPSYEETIPWVAIPARAGVMSCA